MYFGMSLYMLLPTAARQQQPLKLEFAAWQRVRDPNHRTSIMYVSQLSNFRASEGLFCFCFVAILSLFTTQPVMS